MKLKYEFETLEMEDELIAVPVGDNADELHGVLKINDSAAFILDCLKEDTTEETIIDKILSSYDSSREEVSALVHAYIGELNAARLLI